MSPTWYHIGPIAFEAPIIVACIASCTTILVGLIVQRSTKAWQKRQFKEDRQLKWVDDQLIELYGPLTAAIHTFHFEQLSYVDVCNSIFNDEYALTKEDVPIVVTNTMPEEQLAQIRQSLDYGITVKHTEHQFLQSIHKLIIDHYELAEPQTKLKLLAVQTALRVYRAWEEGLINEQRHEEIMEEHNVYDRLHDFYAESEVITHELREKRSGIKLKIITYLDGDIPVSKLKRPKMAEYYQSITKD